MKKGDWLKKWHELKEQADAVLMFRELTTTKEVMVGRNINLEAWGKLTNDAATVVHSELLKLLQELIKGLEDDTDNKPDSEANDKISKDLEEIEKQTKQDSSTWPKKKSV